MYITHLSYTNFRNYARLELDLPPTLIVLYGDNAQGKTNLLEGMYFLATTKSPYATLDREMIHWLAQEEGAPFARLAARVQKGKSSAQVEIVLTIEEKGKRGEGAEEYQESLAEHPGRSGGKRIKVDGQPRRASDLIGQINVVMFSPLDTQLIGGPPFLRRRYLDISLSQVDRRYLRALQQYSRILLQRNHLLRQIRDRLANTAQLDFWDRKLAEVGSSLVQRRRQFLASLQDRLREIHLEFTEGQERLQTVYVASGSGGGENAFQEEQRDIEERLARALSGQRDREIALGMTLVGPHRDDLQFFVDGKDMRIYASRGQQRTLALSLKLAETHYLLDTTGESPVLLLDDVLSELDAQRRRRLMASLAPDQQVLLTTTILDDLQPALLHQAALLRVHQGTIGPRTLPLSTPFPQ